MEVTEASYDDDDWVDVMGKGIRVKSIVKCGGDPADMQTVVTCNLKGYFVDDVDHLRAFENLSNQVFVIGELDTLPSIELTLRHSHVGDIYWLRTSYKFAYGLLGRSGVPRESVRDTTTQDRKDKDTAEAAPIVAVPPNMDLEFYIEVTGHYQSAFDAARAVSLRKIGEIAVTDEAVGRTASEDVPSHAAHVLADTDLRKTCGNRWFACGDYPKAGKAYAKGIEYAQKFLQNDSAAEAGDSEAKKIVDGDAVDNTEEEAEDEAASRSDVKSKGELLLSLIACLNNLSACYLSMKDYTKAKETCVQALQLEPDNVKALIRASKASLALHEYEECALCLSTVQQLAPDNPSLAIELNRLKVARAAYQAREKQMAKNMASKLFPDLKKAGKGAPKNKSESDRKETVEASTPSPDLKVTNDLSIGKGRVEVEADSGSVIVQEAASSSAAPARMSAPPQGEGQGQGQGGSSRGIKSNGDGDKDGEGSSRKGASSGVEGKVAGEAAELGAATPSALLMIVCSTAVLVLSLFIALYLK